jgi:hypothetical protein
MKRLLTEIDVDAPPAVVWTVLTDLSAYAEWNPFVVAADGAVALGARLEVRIQPPGGRATTFRPTVTVVDEHATFEWLGHLGIPGVFDGRHRFELEPTPTGTRFVQSEEFGGVLAPLFAGTFAARTRAGFEAMNRALKTRAEAIVTQAG